MGVLKSLLALLGRPAGDPVPTLAAAGVAPLDDDAADDEHPGDDPGVLEAWDDLQMFIQRCEAEALDLAGLDLADPATFMSRQARIERLQLEGRSYEHSVIAAGFTGVAHWEQVSRYYQARWSQLAVRRGGGREIRLRDPFLAAASAHTAGAPAVDPRVLEPVLGVSLERWARAAAALARVSAHADAAAVTAALAPHGLDRGTYETVNAIWQERMRRDASLTIAARFGAVCEGGDPG